MKNSITSFIQRLHLDEYCIFIKPVSDKQPRQGSVQNISHIEFWRAGRWDGRLSVPQEFRPRDWIQGAPRRRRDRQLP